MDEYTLELNFENNAKHKDLNPHALVKQDNRIINGRWRMNLNQSRIFLSAVSMIEENDTEFELYRIKGKDLKEMLELKGNSLYDQLNKDVPKLMRTVIEIETPKEKTGKKTKEWVVLVSYARYDGGDLLIRFNNDMKPYLLNLKNKFTQFKLTDAMKFKSMYAMRLYLLLKQFESTGWRHITVEEIRECMDLNKTSDNNLNADMYPKIADLKKRIIEPALVELRESGFNVEYAEIKDSRRIVAFKFVWKDSAQLPEKIEFKPKDDGGARLLKRMKDLGLNDRQIKYLGRDLIESKVYSLKELSQTVYSIEQVIREKQIPQTKKGGYAYTTFKRKYDLQEF